MDILAALDDANLTSQEAEVDSAIRLQDLDYFDEHWELTIVYLFVMCLSTGLGLFGNIMVGFQLFNNVHMPCNFILKFGKWEISVGACGMRGFV